MEDHVNSASDTTNSDSTPKSKDFVLIPTNPYHHPRENPSVIILVTSSMNGKESMQLEGNTLGDSPQVLMANNNSGNNQGQGRGNFQQGRGHGRTSNGSRVIFVL
ncbi:hypothetical protein A2U01_0018971, partial [Trifolium medium]|nr:hypothetical protein [Trifolium medium]